MCRYAGVRFGIIFGGIPQQELDRYLAEVRERFERVWIYEGCRCLLPFSSFKRSSASQLSNSPLAQL